jgi:hypothetical protein
MTTTKTDYLLLAKNLLARSKQALGLTRSDPYAAFASFDTLVAAKDSLNDQLPAVRSNALDQIAQVVQTHPAFFTGRDNLGNAAADKVKTIAAADVDPQVQSQAAQLDTLLDASRLKTARKFRLTPFPLAR